MGSPDPRTALAADTRLSLAMAGTGIGLFVLAGALLWWREGDKLFTDGLVAALMRCF